MSADSRGDTVPENQVTLRPATAATLAALLPLAACQTQPPQPAVAEASLTAPYRIDSGDRLRVVVYGEPDLSNSYTVDSSGAIALPLVGAIAARGRTTALIEAEIAKKLGGRFVRNPDVTVEIDRYRPLFVMGEVTNAGQYPYVDGMTVQSAIATAGGFSPRAAKRGFDVTRVVDGTSVTFRLGPNDPVLPGDTIDVGERFL
ncbi:polysaccharide biosynthesis/export family protein [Prosthecomicrobium pneumaticum]|uniref:Polysaccharide export outer membrane protein n=1 Tax=Prosthecomicrobium pneumaticum TaxID=81895 RepID=A0A7W9FQ98_9HYPH|nr:polysaccharide biosynthesis/export family protein [Prosthecomicrobium pneumaticum]MBB5754781.1 polysaccharide export outer membrane protein [Prosthecomicrobium pneumaticum]